VRWGGLASPGDTVAPKTITRQVSTTPERAYEGWLKAFDEFPKLYPQRFEHAAVLSHKGNERVTTCTEIWHGRKMTYKMRQTLHPGRAIDEVIFEGHGKGTKARWTFSPAPGGTQVQVAYELKGVEAFFGRLFPKAFDKELGEVADLWVKALERGTV